MAKKTNQNKEQTQSIWDLGWDENWDSEASSKTDSATGSLANVFDQADQKAPSFSAENDLEHVLLDPAQEDHYTREFDLQWGSKAEIRPTNLKNRIKNIILPFTKASQREKQANKSVSLLDDDLSLNVEETVKATSSTTEEEKQANQQKQKQKQKISISIPKVKSTLAKQKSGIAPIAIQQSELVFHNLNSVPVNEFDDVYHLLEGSLGKAEEVAFDEEVISEENVNFVNFEKAKKLKTSEEEIKKEETEKIDTGEETISAGAEETIVSDSSLEQTLVPDLHNVRFDLNFAQENTGLFEEHEVDAVLERIPLERQRLQLAEEGEEPVDGFNKMEIGETLFDKNMEEAGLSQDALDTTDDLLDSLLDEIDGELGENSFADSEFDESSTQSLGQDEILSEEAILNDDDDAALEFMDSAALEVDSLFEDFFKQDDEEKEVEKKVTWRDKFNEKMIEVKGQLQLFKRFFKDPKYFFEYYHITTKDIYVSLGLLFCYVIYTGVIHYQAITQRFPMNFF